MKLADVGWVWEGHGLDPGVHPSIFGVGEGAAFFGLRRAHFMFHPITELALKKLGHLDEVVCDISKWGYRDTPKGGSESIVDSRLDTVCTEAERVSRLSRTYPNLTGAIFDDLKGLLEREELDAETCAAIVFSLRMYNAAPKLWAVIYSHELETGFWDPYRPNIDVVNLWVWRRSDLVHLDEYIDRCRAAFPENPIVVGSYLRDYPSQVPMPMDALQGQWKTMLKALEDGRIQGYAIQGTVLIDGQVKQASWVRDLIRDHS